MPSDAAQENLARHLREINRPRPQMIGNADFTRTSQKGFTKSSNSQYWLQYGTFAARIQQGFAFQLLEENQGHEVPRHLTESQTMTLGFLWSASRLVEYDREAFVDAMNQLLENRSQSLDAMIKTLMGLLEDGDYNEDYLIPDEEAISVARNLLERAGAYVDGYFPLAHVYPDGDGGVGIQWDDGTAKVSLRIPREGLGNPSLYYRWNNTEYGTERNVQPVSLSQHLNRLNRNGRS